MTDAMERDHDPYSANSSGASEYEKLEPTSRLGSHLGSMGVKFTQQLKAKLPRHITAGFENQPEELIRRVVSSLILAPIVLFLIYWGGFLFYLGVAAAAVLMSFEWRIITTAIPKDEEERQMWMVRGVAYISIGVGAFLWLRTYDYHVALWVMVVVWATDIGAYFAGRRIGGARLAPSISPNKTWAGLGGGVLAAMCVGGFMALFSAHFHFWTLLFVGALVAVVAQGGDLLESWIKRYFGMKESGSLIPGHGGILDRVDGLMTAAPFVMLLILLFVPNP